MDISYYETRKSNNNENNPPNLTKYKHIKNELFLD